MLLEVDWYHEQPEVLPKMEVLQRQAYGFRNFNNYRLRVKVLRS